VLRTSPGEKVTDSREESSTCDCLQCLGRTLAIRGRLGEAIQILEAGLNLQAGMAGDGAYVEASSEFSSGNAFSARRYDQNRQCSLAARDCGSGVGLPAPLGSGALLKRQQGFNQEIKDLAWKAQWRLRTRYKKLAAHAKNKSQLGK
jgi:hypothetical protein